MIWQFFLHRKIAWLLWCLWLNFSVVTLCFSLVWMFLIFTSFPYPNIACFPLAPNRAFLQTPNVTATSSTLAIRWKPPALGSRNGLISVYHVSCSWLSSLQSKPRPNELVRYAAPITRTPLQQESPVSVTLEGLEELAIYEVQITACTKSSMCAGESFRVSTKGKAGVSFSLFCYRFPVLMSKLTIKIGSRSWAGAVCELQMQILPFWNNFSKAISQRKVHNYFLLPFPVLQTLMNAQRQPAVACATTELVKTHLARTGVCALLGMWDQSAKCSWRRATAARVPMVPVVKTGRMGMPVTVSQVSTAWGVRVTSTSVQASTAVQDSAGTWSTTISAIASQASVVSTAISTSQSARATRVKMVAGALIKWIGSSAIVS